MNLYIVLENIKFDLTTPKLNEFAAEASQETKTRYLKWHKVDIVARCYILASVDAHMQDHISKLEWSKNDPDFWWDVC